MANTQHTQGPGQRVFSIGQRIVTLLAEMVETRLRLVVVELEEEKANLFQLLIADRTDAAVCRVWPHESAGAGYLGR